MIALLYGAAILLLTVSNLHKMLLLWKYFRHARNRASVLPAVSEGDLPSVTVQLPLYNERYVAERVLRAAAALDYPADKLEIQILDDSTDDTSSLVAAVAAEIGRGGTRITHLRRGHRREYKAGALSEGMSQARGELIAVFDADFVPGPDFLRATVPHFRDANVGMVQAKWSFLNEKASLLTRAQSIFLNGHFVIEHGARFRAGHFFNFNGTAGVWRKSAIVAAGGWSGDTLTEDLDLSYRAQLKGWKFVYLDEVEVPSELPADLASVKAQQFRWVKGMVQVARKLLGTLWKSDFPLSTKIDATFHLFSCAGYVSTTLAAVMLVPYLIYWKTATQPFAVWWELTSLVLNLGGVLAYFTAAEKENGTLGPRRIVDLLLLIPVGVGLSVNGMRAVLSGLWGRQSPFERTPKFGCVDDQRSMRADRYRLGLGGLNLWGCEVALAGYYLFVTFAVGEVRNPAALAALWIFGSGYCYLASATLFSFIPRTGARHGA